MPGKNVLLARTDLMGQSSPSSGNPGRGKFCDTTQVRSGEPHHLQRVKPNKDREICGYPNNPFFFFFPFPLTCLTLTRPAGSLWTTNRE